MTVQEMINLLNTYPHKHAELVITQGCVGEFFDDPYFYVNPGERVCKTDHQEGWSMEPSAVLTIES